MSVGNEGRPDRAALQHLLDVYGGDIGRWPDGSGRRFASLLADDPQARACFAQARALDSVLARAPQLDGARQQHLAARIVAEVEAGRPVAGPAAVYDDGKVVDLASARRRPHSSPASSRRAIWQTVAVLAASLILGVAVGQSGSFGTGFGDVAALVGGATDTDTLTAALDQTVEIPVEEDSL